MIKAMEFIQYLCYLLLFIPIPLTMWQFSIGVFGIKKTKKTKAANKNSRFAVLICAKDEQAVIGQLLNSLNSQNYKKEDYTIFVVADNCTDNTAQIASQCGAIVFERFNSILKGKGYAMEWAIKKINKEYNNSFDAFAVFDADNLVDPDFLFYTNNALQNGADITQGFRDTKNPFDSTISGCYAIYWLLIMRFFHCARKNLGLSCMVGGTGFAFKAELVKDGFKSKTMTEDIEFSINQILLGKKIVPVSEAIFYDEQPTDFKTSLTQRFRWIVGNIQCAKYILPEMMSNKTGKKPKNMIDRVSRFDMFLYMQSALIIPFVTVASIIFNLFSLVLSQGELLLTIKNMLIPFAITSLIIILTAFASVVLERKSILKKLKSILFFPLFLLPLPFMSVIALIPRKVEWKPIKHNCIVEISEMSYPANIA